MTKKRLESRCGHFEQVKVGSNWKCVACGERFSIEESMQNSLEMSDVMKSAFDNKRTLGESLDEMLGRKEWETIRGRIGEPRRVPRKKR